MTRATGFQPAMKQDGNLSFPLGIRMNFRNGVHIDFPADRRELHLRITSLGNGQSIVDETLKRQEYRPISFSSRQTYRIPWEVEVRQKGQRIFLYRMDLTGKDVCVNLLPGALGDQIAWLQAALTLKRETNCRLHILLRPEHAQIFESAHPDVTFVTMETFRPEDYYAIYPVGVWGYGNFDHNPTDFQEDNLIVHACNILGVPINQEPPKLAESTKDCKAEFGSYVCIATRASKKMKQWNHPGAWEKIVDYLKGLGYRVFCIDADADAMPPNAENATGLLPLRERIDLLSGAEFFIGGTSGLAWIAWACKIPVALISGCTESWVEFITPYRIIDRSVCHACHNWGDMRFDDFDKCVAEKDYECTKAITPERVMQVIERIPAVKDRIKTDTKDFEISILLATNPKDKNATWNAIQNARAQTYRNFELLLCDDNPESKLKKLAQDDNRIKILKRNGPQIHTLLQNASKPYVTCIDVSYNIKPDFIQNAAEILANYPCQILELPFTEMLSDRRRMLNTNADNVRNGDNLLELLYEPTRGSYNWTLAAKIFQRNVLAGGIDDATQLNERTLLVNAFANASSYRFAACQEPVLEKPPASYNEEPPKNLDEFKKLCQEKHDFLNASREILRKHKISQEQQDEFARFFAIRPVEQALESCPPKAKEKATEIARKLLDLFPRNASEKT